jgi:hypothetical protein
MVERMSSLVTIIPEIWDAPRYKMYGRNAKKQNVGRLKNWGLWSVAGGMPYLGTPAYIDIMQEYFPADCKTLPDDADAQHIEDTIIGLNILGRRGLGWGDVYKRILEMEFIDPYRGRDRPQSLKADIIRWTFGFRGFSKRTYRHHYKLSKLAVFVWSDSIHTK